MLETEHGASLTSTITSRRSDAMGNHAGNYPSTKNMETHLHHHFEVLWRNAVAQLNRFVERLAEDVERVLEGYDRKCATKQQIGVLYNEATRVHQYDTREVLRVAQSCFGKCP